MTDNNNSGNKNLTGSDNQGSRSQAENADQNNERPEGDNNLKDIKTAGNKNPANKRQTGNKYEDIAAHFLKQNGYVILDRNFRIRTGEIDVIAKDGETIVFAEVKYRSSDAYGYPSEAVTPAKQRKIIAVSDYYMLVKGLGSCSRRYDVVEIIGDRIRIIRNCFGG